MTSLTFMKDVHNGNWVSGKPDLSRDEERMSKRKREVDAWED